MRREGTICTREAALRYLAQHRNGTIDELVRQCGEEIVNGFELTGIIKRGQEKNRESSYEFTPFGEELNEKYVRLDETYKPSHIGRFQNFINRLLSDKCLFSRSFGVLTSYHRA